MPIRAHCPSCQTEYTLVDSLRGKYVRCEQCHQSFQANPTRQEPSGESPAQTNFPPLQITPPQSGSMPRTILNAGDHPGKNVPLLSREARQETSRGSGAAKAGFPIGVVFLAFFAIRACISLSNSTLSDRNRWEPPRNQLPRMPDNVIFQNEKERGIVVVPVGKQDGEQPDVPLPWFPGKDGGKDGGQNRK
jgi:predicted Zn finger-like uncharacterized protein